MNVAIQTTSVQDALRRMLRPAPVVARHAQAILGACGLGPVLDVACGGGRNGLYLAALGARAILVDASAQALAQAGQSRRAVEASLGVRLDALLVRMDLETVAPPRFRPQSLGAVVVSRYLHRPLVPVLAAALRPGGVLVYETFLMGHEVYGKPRNPLHLLAPGELAAWFAGWQALEAYEGPETNPPSVVGRIVCRKP